jgi:uncharacterized protein YjiS (DUF1127 family)
MTTIKTIARRQPSGAPTVADAVRRVAVAMTAVWSSFRNRRQIRHLAALDDHLLADVGLTRADVEAAADLPLHEDPTRYIALTVGMRGVGGDGVIHYRPGGRPIRRR